ncbi:hypothetical protein M0804_004262 [Polistes exclamans]|nr:hypothetical protein M0804_004262 [Polistes exclamans]
MERKLGNGGLDKIDRFSTIHREEKDKARIVFQSRSKLKSTPCTSITKMGEVQRSYQAKWKRGEGTMIKIDEVRVINLIDERQEYEEYIIIHEFLDIAAKQGPDDYDYEELNEI